MSSQHKSITTEQEAIEYFRQEHTADGELLVNEDGTPERFEETVRKLWQAATESTARDFLGRIDIRIPEQIRMQIKAKYNLPEKNRTEPTKG